MDQSIIDLLHLPNELLLYILNKLDNVDVLYSLFGINNQRLDRLVEKKTFSTSLNLTSNLHSNRRIESILDRFCNSILPRIDFNVKCLIVESASMERVLLAGHYPNLTELKLFHFQRDNSLDYFTDHSSVRHIIKEQIRKLHLVNEDRERVVGSSKDYTQRVYARILNYFDKLEHLNVIQTSMFAYPHLTVRYLPSNSFSSQTLTYLSINVRTFIDCLCLLDGRLKQLSTFIVQICSMDRNSSIVHNLNILPNLKCFSLIYYGLIEQYDHQIVSLLRRMIYLEKLTLYLRFAHQNVFIDPIGFLNEFLMHMPRLTSFKFYLSTEYNRDDFVRYLSNNDIKQNYTNIGYEQILNTVCFSVDTATYNIFTVPFEFEVLMDIGNKFPNIVFKYVIELWVQDVLPFEHEFFLRIAQAFPLLKKFYVTDLEESDDENNISDNVQSYEIIQYPYLTLLDITGAEISNIERFLNEKKTHLPCLTELHITYNDLAIVTNDFTREATRKTCANVTRLITGRQIVGSKDYYNYFPLL